MNHLNKTMLWGRFPLRALIQGIYILFFIYVGWRFFLFYKWAINPMPVSNPPIRPGAVEAFLPLSALMAFKRLLLTGKYDQIHPAGLTIFLALMVSSFLFRKGFCGWICPVGSISNALEAVGRRLNLACTLPKWIDLPLLSLKYLLLGFFIYMIVVKMTLSDIERFLFSPYNIAADAKMLQFFLNPSRMVVGVLAFLILLSVIIRNFWCRYLCPYGLYLGLFAIAGPLHVKRNTETCTKCKLCEKACPSSIPITKYEKIRNIECIGCSECVSSCKANSLRLETLFYRTSKSEKDNNGLSPFLIPAGVIFIILSFWLVAKITGHWDSQVPPDIFSLMYKMVLRLH